MPETKYQKVHVIKPSGTRFEYLFGEKDSDEQILTALASIKSHFGTAKTIKKADEKFGFLTDHPDHSSGFAFDHPDCAVVVIEEKDGKVVEVRRLKGPPA